MKLRFFVVLLGAFLISGCQSVPQSGHPLYTRYERGVLAREEGVYFFRDCYSSRRMPVTDTTGELDNWFRTSPLALGQVYAELMTYSPKHRPLDKQIEKILMLGGTAHACDFELEGNRFRAAGDDPLWIADVRDEGIRVQSYGLRQLIFPRVEPVVDGTRWVWKSELKAQETYRLTLELQEQACTDQYGARYRYRAQMEINNASYSGCAREGDLGRRVLPGVYSYESSRQSLSLKLDEDGGARYIEGHREGADKVLIHTQGVWTLRENGRLLVELTGEDGVQQLLFFSRGADGALTLIQSDGTAPRVTLRRR